MPVRKQNTATRRRSTACVDRPRNSWPSIDRSPALLFPRAPSPHSTAHTRSHTEKSLPIRSTHSPIIAQRSQQVSPTPTYSHLRSPPYCYPHTPSHSPFSSIVDTLYTLYTLYIGLIVCHAHAP